MRYLRAGITTKITDTGRLRICSDGEIFGPYPLWPSDPQSELVVLTIQTVEGTPIVKDREVLKAILRAFCP
jgi:hypothetical protein